MTIAARTRGWLWGAWVGAVTALSLLPASWLRGAGAAPEGSDKFAHVALYAGWVWLGAWAEAARRRCPLDAVALGGWILTAVIYGALMEVAQAMLPIERSFSYGDMAANAAGAAVGALAWAGWHRRRRDGAGA